MGLRTEFSFTLPRGLVSAEGDLHQRGVMRMATARDEIEPLRDPRVTDSEDSLVTLLILARVVALVECPLNVAPPGVLLS